MTSIDKICRNENRRELGDNDLMFVYKKLFISFCIYLLSSSLCGSIYAVTRAYKTVNEKDSLLKKELNNQFLTEDEIEEKDSFFDTSMDYSTLSGRVTDRDSTMKVLRIKSEMKNIKFFRSGDLVHFKISSYKNKRPCKSYVRDIEKGYFTIYVEDFYPCFGRKNYFRRGTVLIFTSKQLAARILEASLHRKVLIKRRRDFFKQLNRANHFLWSYKEQKVRVAQDYDLKMSALKKAKEHAINSLRDKKVDYITLQRELIYRLNSLDKDLDFYRIERDDLMIDRWHLDHDLALPVGRRPQGKVLESKNL